MKNTRCLAILICAMLLSAVCGGGFALAGNDPSGCYYYGISAEPDVLPVDFRNGIVLRLEQLRGYERVGIRIGDRYTEFADKDPDSDAYAWPVDSEDLFSVAADYLMMELIGTVGGNEHVLWEGAVQHDSKAADEAFFRFVALEDGVKGFARAGIELGLTVEGTDEVRCRADEDGAFAFDAELVPGNDVILTVYDDVHEMAAYFQSFGYTVDEAGSLAAMAMDGSESSEASGSPVLVVTMDDGQQKEYAFGSGNIAVAGSGSVEFVCPGGSPWKIWVMDEDSEETFFEQEVRGEERCVLSLDEIMPEERGYQIDIARAGEQKGYSLRVVRDLTPPRLYLPSDDKLTAPLKDGSVIPHGTPILVVYDQYSDNSTVYIDGEPVAVSPKEIRQKEFLTFGIGGLAGGEVKISVFDELGNSKEYLLTMDKTELTLNDADSEALLTANNPACTLSGAGEPGAEVLMSVNGGKTQLVAVVNENGDWSAEISADALGLDGVKQLALFYDGSEDSAVRKKVSVDTKCSLNLDACEAGMSAVTGTTDENAVVTLNCAGQTQTAAADAQGAFAFALGEPLKAGDVLKISAEDALGNASIALEEQVMTRPVLTLDAQSSAITTETTAISGAAFDADYVIISGIGRVEVLPDGSFSSAIPPLEAGETVEIYAIRESDNRESERAELTVAELAAIAVEAELPEPNARHSYEEALRVKGFAFSRDALSSLRLFVGDVEVGKIELRTEIPTDEELGRISGRSSTNSFARFDAKFDVSALPLGETVVRIAADDGSTLSEIPIVLMKNAQQLTFRIAALAALLAGFAASAAAYVLIGKKMSRIRREKEKSSVGRKAADRKR